MPKITCTGNSPFAKLDAVAIDQVTLRDGFWKPKIEVNRTASIPHQYAECERTGRIDNFRRAAGRPTLHPVPKKRTGLWGISTKVEGHPAFEGLGPLIHLVSEGLPTEDECCYWDDPNNVHGTWLADWEHPANKVVCGEYLHGTGRAVFIGTGAYYWHVPEGENLRRGNVERLTENVVRYVGGTRVAFLGTPADETSLAEEPAEALRWAKGAIGAEYVPWSRVHEDLAALGGFRCLWWHLTGEPDMPDTALDPAVVASVLEYIDKGGGLFLTGFAAQYLTTLGLEPTPPTTIRQEQKDGFRGIFFNDSDVYKWMEAACYSLASDPDEALERQLDELVELIAEVQEDDGYLNTYFMFEHTPERWNDLTVKHELYLGGHMIQGAIAHHRVTGKESFLDVAAKWADHCCRRFGPDANPGTPGHPELEMALVELYRATGEDTYLDLASFFIEQRGKGVLNGSHYLQDHVPIREQTYVTGHAVRQMYLCAGVADLYAERGDESLWEVLQQQWHDFTGTKLYVTGGAGARREGEAFGEPYELPNDIAYAETCAAIGSFMWNWRMLQITGEAKYADVMEQAAYNGLLSGSALDGRAYFYTNPLEHDGRQSTGTHYTNRRTSAHWDGCACCPPNVARTLSAFPGYMYGTGENAVYVHQYMQSTARIDVAGTAARFEQETDYPWDGSIEIAVHPENPVMFALCLRYPGWASDAKVSVAGRPVDTQARSGSYIRIERRWESGDVVKVEFPMPVEKVLADPRVTADTGRLALRRGPVVYCLEQTDHPGVDLFKLAVDRDAAFETRFWPDLLGGVAALEGQGFESSWPDSLYASVDHLEDRLGKAVEIRAIPYFAWANREPGSMRVWIPYL